jgi:acetyl-CoA carboxylase biotin carboxyl carrier protein
MEINSIKKLYRVVAENGYSEFELKIGKNNKLKFVLDNAIEKSDKHNDDNKNQNETNSKVLPTDKNTTFEVFSDKVGVYVAPDKTINVGDKIKKEDNFGFVKGISFKDPIKFPKNGIIKEVCVSDGEIVDYGKLLCILQIGD